MPNEMELKKEVEKVDYTNSMFGIDDVEVKIEDDENDISGNLHQFSYTLDLSYSNSNGKKSCPAVTSDSGSTLKYVKVNDDNTIETNSENPWTVAKSVFPRSLQRILQKSGYEIKKKKISASKSFRNKNSSVGNDDVSLNDGSYISFQPAHNMIFNSTVNPEVLKKGELSEHIDSIKENSIKQKVNIDSCNQNCKSKEKKAMNENKIDKQKREEYEMSEESLDFEEKTKRKKKKHIENVDILISSLRDPIEDITEERNLDDTKNNKKLKKKKKHKNELMTDDNTEEILGGEDAKTIKIEIKDNPVEVMKEEEEEIMFQRKMKKIETETISSVLEDPVSRLKEYDEETMNTKQVELYEQNVSKLEIDKNHVNNEIEIKDLSEEEKQQSQKRKKKKTYRKW
ncbi:hypothetical protein HHI36_019422 [Cryptolaemus montrouzieri]|uniref:Uncharacterized protein n=1 Tax=Cryptolaemus montrouzieri TaxID=559131 RepID=A0ABD2P2W0_9CUCU